jgi:hypothetical protein
MAPHDHDSWVPFRPNSEDLKALARDVAEVRDIQQTLLGKHAKLHTPDRVAHQYQLAGGKVHFHVADNLPARFEGVGLFRAKAQYVGVGRISTGLGIPHLETNPDFLGAMFAFQTASGRRVDFLGINDPTAPTDNHRDFVDVLHACAESAGAHIPLVGEWGQYDVFNLIAEQTEFGNALKNRMGWVKAGQTLVHLTKATIRVCQSSTAYQTYWTGVSEVAGLAGKFQFVPTRDENRRPQFRPGERHLSEEWRQRQAAGAIEFSLYWIAYVNEDQTPTAKLTERWGDNSKQLVGTISFPQTDYASQEAKLWAALAAEMGANPGNWVHDASDTIREPATSFGAARKLAYQLSQAGRNALDPQLYASVFQTGEINAALAQELQRRRAAKGSAGHVDSAP